MAQHLLRYEKYTLHGDTKAERSAEGSGQAGGARQKVGPIRS